MFKKSASLPFTNDASALFLPWMIMLMVFFATLSTAGVLSLNSMVGRWGASVSGSLTVQILPAHENGKIDRLQMQRETEQVLALLRSTAGVSSAGVLTERQLKDLLKPWLNETVLMDDLPMPRLIDVQLLDGAKIDLNELAERMSVAAPHASMDVHKLWMGKLYKLATALEMLGSTVLSLVFATTSLIVIYVTVSSFRVHRPIVELLHQMGARDNFICRRYAERIAVFSFLGAIFGIGAALPVLFSVASLVSGFGGGLLSEARFTAANWCVVGLIPAGAVALSTFCAYLTVRRTLRRMP